MKIDQIAANENNSGKTNGSKANKRLVDVDWITNLYHHFNDPLSSEDVEGNEDKSYTKSPSQFG